MVWTSTLTDFGLDYLLFSNECTEKSDNINYFTNYPEITMVGEGGTNCGGIIFPQIMVND